MKAFEDARINNLIKGKLDSNLTNLHTELAV